MQLASPSFEMKNVVGPKNVFFPTPRTPLLKEIRVQQIGQAYVPSNVVDPQIVNSALDPQVISDRKSAANWHGRFSLALFGAMSVSSLVLSIYPLAHGDSSTETWTKSAFIGGCTLGVLTREIGGYFHRQKRLEVPNSPRLHPDGFFGICDITLAMYSIILGVSFNDPLTITTGSLIALRAIIPYKKVISASCKIQSLVRSLWGSKT